MDENDRLQDQVERFNRNNPDVPDLVAEVERLTAERAALLAPVEGVDLDEVLRLDRDGTPAERWKVDLTSRWEPVGAYVRYIAVNEYREVTRPYGIDDFPARDAELEAALAPIRTDEALIKLYRTAAPALAREVIQLRAAVRFADEQGAEAIDRVSRAIVADKWNTTAKLQEEVKRLTAELEEARRAPAGVLAEVAAERARQVAKGYTAEHDDGAEMGELAELAGLLLLNDFDLCDIYPDVQIQAQVILDKYDEDRRRQLIIALAMGLAEVERLDRLRARVASTPAPGPE